MRVKLHARVTPNEDTRVSQTDGNTDAVQADIWRKSLTDRQDVWRLNGEGW